MDLRRLFFAVMIVTFTQTAQAQSPDSFEAWTERFVQEAMAQGVAPATLREALPLFVYDESVIELDQKQPEGKKTFAQYLKGTLPDRRIERARELYAENIDTLRSVSALYGVPPQIIVALWGIESSFGENTGDYDVISSLATLAYEGRRAEFFKKELVHALHIVEREQRPVQSLKGSWAGAMGQCQFMPSTYVKFAMDHNGDGSRDIWYDTQDTLASIANYLAAEGWQAGMGWGYEIIVPASFDIRQTGPEVVKPRSAWAKLGVRAKSGEEKETPDTPMSLILPDGEGGRAFLVTNNFRAVMRWNRSTYFATTVGLFSDLITQE